MDPIIIAVISALVALVAGILIGKVIFSKNTANRIAEAERQAEAIIQEATQKSETLKEKRILEAKEKFLQLKSEHEKEVIQKNSRIAEQEQKVKQKEQALNDKINTVQKQANENQQLKENLEKQIEIASIKRAELEKHQEEHIKGWKK